MLLAKYADFSLIVSLLEFIDCECIVDDVDVLEPFSKLYDVKQGVALCV